MMRQNKLRFAIVLGAAASSLAFACSAILDLEPPPLTSTQDSGPPSDGAASDGTNADDGSDDGCGTRYVSVSTGSDANDGCSLQRPLKTIRAALAAVDAVGTAGYVIKVCGGTYAEDALIVSLSGSILGSWDCGFTHQVAATQPDGTIVMIATPSTTNKETLRISPPAAATALTTVDRLKIVGASISDSWAAHFSSAAPAKLTNSVVNGGDADHSVALYITGAAAPDITTNTITSGSGVGSQAVSVSSSSPVPGAHIHSNTIYGGQGTTGSGIGSIGISLFGNALFTAAAGAAIENNIIQTMNVSNAAAEGILVNSDTTADVIGNTIRAAGVVLDGELSQGLVGVYVGSSSNVRIIGNRIFTGGARPSYGDFTGIFLSSTASAFIADNMIYAGSHTSDGEAGVPTGILATSAIAPVIVGNTIFTGYPGATKPAFAINFNGLTTGAVVENNILAGVGIDDWGIRVSTCPNGIASLRNNLFIGSANGTLDIAACTDGAAGEKDISTMAPFVQDAGQNLAIHNAGKCSPADVDAGSCIGDARCTTPEACMATVLAEWGTDDGYAGFDVGWHLAPQVSCRVGRGGADLSKDPGHPLTADFFGVPRAVPPAIGAAEVTDGGCD